MKPFRALTLSLLLSLLVSCGSGTGSDTLPTTDPSIRGILGQVHKDEPRILVEANSRSNLANVRLTDETRLVRRFGETTLRANPDDLAVGQTVSVWFSGPVKESFPVQADAGTIVIESDPQP